MNVQIMHCSNISYSVWFPCISYSVLNGYHASFFQGRGFQANFVLCLQDFQYGTHYHVQALFITVSILDFTCRFFLDSEFEAIVQEQFG